MADLTKMLKAAREAVSRASSVCREVQRELESVQSLTKDDRSPVTVADFASQAVVAATLSELLGHRITLIGEEDADELRQQVANGNTTIIDAVVKSLASVWPDATRDIVLDAIDLGGSESDPDAGSTHGFWTLDPIDGTKGFLRRGQYAVSLAWVENGSPILGVLGCPNLSSDFQRPFDDPDPHGVMYVAMAGDGVVELPADQPNAHGVAVERLEPAEGEPIRMCESVESGHTSHDDSERILEKLGEPAEPARLDSQAKYAVVARGQADLYLRLPKKAKDGSGYYVEKIWDHAAGAIVAKEAGVAVTDVFGHELDFSHGRRLEQNRGVVAAPVKLHGAAIGVIEHLGIGR
ncbi:MAG: 3'(2'),5'-bisphosphate nucleotidase [Planctomycetota bacterium]